MMTLFFSFFIPSCPNFAISFDGAWRLMHPQFGGFLPGICRFGLQIRFRHQTIAAAHSYYYFRCYTNALIKPIISLTGLQLPKSSERM
jgi:hypothetical protein